MRASIEAVIKELEALKREGVAAVFLNDGTLDCLATVAARHSQPKSAAGETARTQEKDTEADRAAPVARVELDDARPPVAKHKKPAAAAVPGERETAVIPEPVPFELPEGDKLTRWQALRTHVLNCPVCKAHAAPGKKVVFGVGNLDADIFFCGEAPGAEEETLGEPFVGPAGKLLTRIIEAMGLQRKSVYIGNIMNWRPEHRQSMGNRPPNLTEMRFCLPYLKAQITIIQPRVIVALGATAAQGLLNLEQRVVMGKNRGTWHSCSDIPMMITYHPSYLLHNDTVRSKRVVWEDMMAVMEKIGMDVTAKQRRYFLKPHA